MELQLGSSVDLGNVKYSSAIHQYSQLHSGAKWHMTPDRALPRDQIICLRVDLAMQSGQSRYGGR